MLGGGALISKDYFYDSKWMNQGNCKVVGIIIFPILTHCHTSLATRHFDTCNVLICSRANVQILYTTLSYVALKMSSETFQISS